MKKGSLGEEKGGGLEEEKERRIGRKKEMNRVRCGKGGERRR